METVLWIRPDASISSSSTLTNLSITCPQESGPCSVESLQSFKGKTEVDSKMHPKIFYLCMCKLLCIVRKTALLSNHCRHWFPQLNPVKMEINTLKVSFMVFRKCSSWISLHRSRGLVLTCQCKKSVLLSLHAIYAINTR